MIVLVLKVLVPLISIIPTVRSELSKRPDMGVWELARYRCTVCGGTVSTHTGTAYSGLRCARRECDQVASLRVEGVSTSATARVTGHSRQTIAR